MNKFCRTVIFLSLLSNFLTQCTHLYNTQFSNDFDFVGTCVPLNFSFFMYLFQETGVAFRTYLNIFSGNLSFSLNFSYFGLILNNIAWSKILKGHYGCCRTEIARFLIIIKLTKLIEIKKCSAWWFFSF